MNIIKCLQEISNEFVILTYTVISHETRINDWWKIIS